VTRNLPDQPAADDHPEETKQVDFLSKPSAEIVTDQMDYDLIAPVRTVEEIDNQIDTVIHEEIESTETTILPESVVELKAKALPYESILQNLAAQETEDIPIFVYEPPLLAKLSENDVPLTERVIGKDAQEQNLSPEIQTISENTAVELNNPDGLIEVPIDISTVAEIEVIMIPPLPENYEWPHVEALTDDIPFEEPIIVEDVRELEKEIVEVLTHETEKPAAVIAVPVEITEYKQVEPEEQREPAIKFEVLPLDESSLTQLEETSYDLALFVKYLISNSEEMLAGEHEVAPEELKNDPSQMDDLIILLQWFLLTVMNILSNINVFIIAEQPSNDAERYPLYR
jgi:hypothetical protein